MAPYRRPRRRAAWLPRIAEVRITLWSGLLVGLILFNAVNILSGPAAALEPLTYAGPHGEPATRQLASHDRLAGSKEYRRSLEQQEGPPSAISSLTRERSSGGSAVRVIDGDTFDYAGQRIRIADIDTPELRARCPREADLAAAATVRLRSLLASGPFELERLGRDEDRYGRKLRIVTRGGRSLGDVLVSEGLARTWTGRREPWC